LKDTKITGITIDKNIILDLDGHKISSDAPGLFTINSN